MRQGFLFPDMLDSVAHCTHCHQDTWKDNLDDDGLCPPCHAASHGTCDSCDQEFHVGDLTTVPENDRYYEETFCTQCYEKHIFLCHDCDTESRYHDEHHHDSVCNKCGENYFYCDDCREYQHDDNRHHDDICESCGEDYSRCEQCEEWHRNEDLEEDRCEECLKAADELEEFDPGWKLHGKGRHFGVEMEFECPQGTRRDTRNALHDHFGLHAALQEDGSLVNGIEVATQPATHALQVQWWEEFYNTGIPDDVDVSRRCGMHVHIERTTITPLTLGKMMVFLNRVENRKFICKMSGRDFIYNGDYKDEVKLTDKGKHKYEALNTLHRETLEIRIFAAARNKVECLGRFEFVVALVDHCQVASMNALDTPSFLRWLEKQPHYPYLREYLKD